MGSSPSGRPTDASQLLPVKVVDEADAEEDQRISTAAPSSEAIHIEFPGRALVTVEGRADASLVRAVLESLRQ